MNTDKLGNFVGPNDLYSTLGKFSSTNSVYDSIDNLSSQIKNNTGVLNSIVSSIASLQSSMVNNKDGTSSTNVTAYNDVICLTNYGTKLGEMITGTTRPLKEGEISMVCPAERPTCKGFDINDASKFGICI